MISRIKKSAFLSISAAVVGVLTIAAFLVYDQYREFLQKPLNLPLHGQVLLVEQGDSLTAVVGELEAEGVTELDWRWRLLARRRPVSIHVGEYRLEPPMRPPQLLEILGSGRVVQHRITIVEGWTWAQLLQALRADPVLVQTIEGFIHPAEVEVIAEEIGAPELDHAEGWFLPETYYFVRGKRDVDILRRAHQAMQKALDEAWQARSVGLPLENRYELLILASIVEKETSLEEERGRIAGVLVRRLQRGMRLQTDPTVIYGLGQAFDGNVRRRDLEFDGPYNTYTRRGLPPTPIALPGKGSLTAAANPAEGEALYFVSNGEGGHTFSATLEEHEAAVQELIEKQ